MIWRSLMSIIAFILTSWLFSVVYTPKVVNVAAETLLYKNDNNQIAYSETLSADGSASSEDLLSGVIVINYSKETDYWKLIKQAVNDGSPYALKMAEIYEAQRNLKIDMEGIPLPKTEIFGKSKSLEEIRRAVDLYDRKPPYNLTLQERQLVERCVMAEAGNESYKGQMAVAQAILDGTLRTGLDVASSIKRYRIVSRSDIPVSESVKKAVSAVFDYGERVTPEKMDVWYAPKRVYSAWHESQNYVTTIGNHKFFWMNE